MSTQRDRNNIDLITLPTDSCCRSEKNTAPATDVTNRPWVVGSVTTPLGEVPRVATELTSADRRGSRRARWCLGRMAYRVEPGLYAAGQPTAESPVFVSANYKMSFDCLRSGLNGINGWILVLDTRGINVWCAAGKGTFGTAEIVKQVKAVRLTEIVTHRRLILPQLGAPGVAAHEVRRGCGFKVRYGPVRANDLKKFMADGMKATPEMRRVRFGITDRIVLVPTEIVQSAVYAIGFAIVLALLSGFDGLGYSLQRLIDLGWLYASMVLLCYLAAAALPPILLPWLPGRAFAIKGAWAGLAIAIISLWILSDGVGLVPNPWEQVGWLLMVLAVSSHLSMRFTGSSTYTSLSGTLKEVRAALPLQIGGALIGLGLWITGQIMGVPA